VFEENTDDGWSRIVENYRTDDQPGEGEAGEELKECVSAAAEGCPVDIIHMG
jgi:ferredoxin